MLCIWFFKYTWYYISR